MIERVGVVIIKIKSPRKDFDDSVTSCRYDKTAILAPNNAAYTLSLHDTMTGNLLDAHALFKTPKSDAGIMAC